MTERRVPILIRKRTLTDTKEKYIAIYSMCAITYLLPISGKSIPSIKLHLSKKRQCLRYVDSPYPNTCVLEAIARYQLKDSKEKRYNDNQVLHKMKEIGRQFFPLLFSSIFSNTDFVGGNTVA
ncbi:MAG: hypothetical protein EZS28_029135 [Streblomastix strix]|uniref:Uncharacterized protein n=1 Tax=Streblomastix strix TaxID=222440 RepID=A0A5J4UXW2_9EUKA|nr:MAG: hypothetical protein EZS28_029135 [Streblomastix strix]